MARIWEEYMFNDHVAVAVSLWKPLQLFDLMAKRNDHFSKTGQAGLRYIRSFFGFGLRKGEDVENLQPMDKLKEALHDFIHLKTTGTSTDDKEEPIIRYKSMPSLEETVSASSKILTSVMEYANVDNSSKAMTCTLDHVSLHFFNREALRAAIDAWKPNMASLTKHTNPSLFRGLVDLFLITDILYAGHVSVEDETSISIGAGVDARLAGQVFGVEVATKVKAQHSRGSKREVTGGNIPISFAIRVVRLRYNSKGELFRILHKACAMSSMSNQIAIVPRNILYQNQKWYIILQEW